MTGRSVLRAALCLAAGLVAGCGSARPRRTLEELRAERAALHERLEAAVGQDAVARRVFAAPSDVVLAVRTRFVGDLAAEVAHRYLDRVVLDLAEVDARAQGEMKANTFLGRTKVGSWRVEVTVDQLKGRLRAEHPRLRFRSDRIDVALPVTVRPAPGRIRLAFFWESTGLANLVCDDFQVERVLEGRVLEQRHELSGTWHLGTAQPSLRAVPEFADASLPLKVDLSPESWAVVSEALQAQDTLARCGILLNPAVVMEKLRALAAAGIRVKLPAALFRTADLPAHLGHEVTLGDRRVGVALRRATLEVKADLLWSTAELEAEATAPPARELEGRGLPARADADAGAAPRVGQIEAQPRTGAREPKP